MRKTPGGNLRLNVWIGGGFVKSICSAGKTFTVIKPLGPAT